MNPIFTSAWSCYSLESLDWISKVTRRACSRMVEWISHDNEGLFSYDGVNLTWQRWRTLLDRTGSLTWQWWLVLLWWSESHVTVLDNSVGLDRISHVTMRALFSYNRVNLTWQWWITLMGWTGSLTWQWRLVLIWWSESHVPVMDDSSTGSFTWQWGLVLIYDGDNLTCEW